MALTTNLSLPPPENEGEEGTVFNVIWNLCYLLALLVGLCANVFVLVRILSDRGMRTINYFLVLNLCAVDLTVLIGTLVVNEVVQALQIANPFVRCFPRVANFSINYTASNFVLLFLCYEKFVLIIKPFSKDKYLSLRIKLSGAILLYLVTVVTTALKSYGLENQEKWCILKYPYLGEPATDIIDSIFLFAVPISIQLALYLYIFHQSYDPNSARTRTPQLVIAKICLVATLVRFILWIPYIANITLVAVSSLSRPDYQLTETQEHLNNYLPDLTICASVFNPIVFITMSPPLRRSLLAPCRRLFCRGAGDEEQPDNNPTTGHVLPPTCLATAC